MRQPPAGHPTHLTPIAVAGLLFAVGCRPAPRLEAPREPAEPAASEPEPEEPCPETGVLACDAYLEAMAECARKASPKARGRVREERTRRCEQWQAPRVGRHSECFDAVVDLLGDPACAPEAATALTSVTAQNASWICGPRLPRPIGSEPTGSLRVAIAPRGKEPPDERTLAVAVDGVGVLARTLHADGKDRLIDGMLGTSRTRLVPGEHLVRLLIVTRSDTPIDGARPLIRQFGHGRLLGVWMSQQCVTIRKDEPVTVTVAGSKLLVR